MKSPDNSKRYCIIGAGACGIAVVKNFKQRGIPFDCFERLDDIGGIWNPASPHVVYETTHLNTSKRLTRYLDYPMPADYPQFLSRRQANDYIQSYARHFGLHDCITFNTEVEKVEQDGKRWRVTIKGEREPRHYDGLVVANGHHWDPKLPDYPGKFAGEMLHTHEVKTRDQLIGKRVLVVGAGNSGCDIAADAASLSRTVLHSMRRTYHFLPKFIFGRPLDVIIDLTQRWPLPRKMLRAMYEAALYILVGPHEKYGLSKPDHRLLEAHPSSASAYLDHLAHGRITVKPDVERLDGRSVVFRDGSRAEVDMIVWATGFNLTFPFMPRDYFVRPDGSSPLFLNVAHRELDNLFCVGLVQPAEGSFWQLADYQARMIASFVIGQEIATEKVNWFRSLKTSAKPSLDHGVTYVDSERHKLEVQHYRYRTYIKKLLKRFGDLDGAPWPTATVPATARAESKPLQMAS
ncbi:MAG: NAD(P)-binding domain-containing protein [Pseudomonadota bacterium]|nr:NAD(P)-binding domain-containing protein [Pseudomonadota bacterium]